MAPSAPCGPRRGTVPPPRPSPWGGAEWEPHGGAAKNSKAFGKGDSPAGWESGSVISAVSELCLQPVSSQPRVTPRGGAAPGAGHPPSLADGVPSPSTSPALGNQGWGLAADADASGSHSLPGCLAQATLAGHQPQLASTPGHTEARARSQLVPQPRNLGSRCLRSLPCSSSARSVL